MTDKIVSTGQTYHELRWWGECVSRTLINLDYSSKEHRFSGSYHYLTASNCVAARLFGTAHRTSRSQRRLRESENDFVLLIYLKTGEASLCHRHFSGTLSAGSFLALDSAKPHELTMSDTFDHLALRMPKTRFLSLHPASSAMLDQPIVGSNRDLAAAASILDMVVSLGGAMPSTISTMSETIVRILGDWVAESDGHGAGRAMRHDMLLRRMLKQLEDNLTDPSYSSTRLAEAMGISRRYVDTIFADANSTFGKTLLAKRLERCRALLSDPRTNRRSVTDIAFESGFNDLSHFSKRFREKFGIAPRLARQAARPTLN